VRGGLIAMVVHGGLIVVVVGEHGFVDAPAAAVKARPTPAAVAAAITEFAIILRFVITCPLSGAFSYY